jgi:hypothetical protein
MKYSNQKNGQDTDISVEIGNTIIPTMKAETTALTNASEVTRMGHYGLSTFYCTDYISAIHPDRDIGVEDLKQKRSEKDCKGACYACVQLEQMVRRRNTKCTSSSYFCAYKHIIKGAR